MEHELLIKELTTHLYLKSEKSREKRAKLVAYMTDSAALAVKGTSTHCAYATYLGCFIVMSCKQIVSRSKALNFLK